MSSKSIKFLYVDQPECQWSNKEWQMIKDFPRQMHFAFWNNLRDKKSRTEKAGDGPMRCKLTLCSICLVNIQVNGSLGHVGKRENKREWWNGRHRDFVFKPIFYGDLNIVWFRPWRWKVAIQHQINLQLVVNSSFSNCITKLEIIVQSCIRSWS